MHEQFLTIKGARQHNLKGISLKIPKHQIVVITGVSGSGKSSLAFDTIFAEGQRRYLEYLSPQARQWIKQMPKPDIDRIEGLSPTLAVDQTHRSLSQRTTVASHTDLQDFFALLFTHVGQQHSPATGKQLIRYTRQQMVEQLLKDYPEGSRIQLIAPQALEHESLEEAVQRLERQGFIRLRINGIDWDPSTPLHDDAQMKLQVVVDRLQINEGIRDRLSGSVETALDLGRGILQVQTGTDGPIKYYTEVYLCPESQLSFAPLTPADFSFYSRRGACPVCKGSGGELVDISGPDREIWIACPACKGARLKPETLACRIEGKNIADLFNLTVSQLKQVVNRWHFSGNEAKIADDILPDLVSRLEFLEDVGLGYLQLDRRGDTLSEGEAQRVQLASQIGAKLSGILYVLDEPSRGLHRRDIQYLIKVIDGLKSLGNSILLVEHDAVLIRHADSIVEMGPGAGIHGGKVIFEGSIKQLLLADKSPTAAWLSGNMNMPKPKKRRAANGSLKVHKATKHNIQNLNLDIPLGLLVGLYGVSGSGKSTLAIDIVAKQIQDWLNLSIPCPSLSNYEQLKRLVLVEQQPAGVTARSTPATYIDLMKPLRELFAQTKLARARGYTAARFSPNRRGGRCEACEGLGVTRVDMQFMPELYVTCDVCQGKRFNYETLQVLWEGRSIADILDLTAEEALGLFRHIPPLAEKLQLMTELGLEYLTLGQRFTSLSGGERQRLKLIAELVRPSTEPTLYIMDEPCVGLHFVDVVKLIRIMHRLVEAGHSIIVVEHNIDLLHQCDWIIELGPEGGPAGGKVVFQGKPEALAKASTATAKVL